MPVPTGTVRLGPVPEGTLPYFVLLQSGDHPEGHGTRKPLRHTSAPRYPSRASSNDSAKRRLRSLLRKHPIHAFSVAHPGRGVATPPPSASTSRDTSGESAVPGQSAATDSGSGATGLVNNGEPSWQLSPKHSLGEAGRAMTSITTTADSEAGKAANTALKVAALSSVGAAAAGGGGGAGSGFGAGGAGGGEGDDGTTETKHPRLRFKITLLCEQGIFLQMEDIHRLESTAHGDKVDPTFEIALALPGQGGQGACATGSPGGSDDTVAAVDVGCPRDECEGEVDGDTGVCESCGLPAPLKASSEDEDEGDEGGERGKDEGSGSVGGSPWENTGLQATLDFEHVASKDILGTEDSLSMTAAFGVEGRYFNPRVQKSEHFIEPWR